jgi:hypothetical protein
VTGQADENSNTDGDRKRDERPVLDLFGNAAVLKDIGGLKAAGS